MSKEEYAEMLDLMNFLAKDSVTLIVETNPDTGVTALVSEEWTYE